MSEPITIPPNTNALADLVVAEDGVWKQGEPRKVAGFTEFYFKADVQEWWVWDGADDHKLLSGLLNGRVPTVVKQWPPVVTDDLVVGDWIFAGPLGGHAVGQIARFIGANRPDPFHYFKVYYEDDTEPGTSLKQPLLSARLTTDNTVRLQFPVLNPVESLSAIWVYRMLNGGVEKLLVYPPGTTEIIDDDLEGIVDGDVLVYVRVDVSGTGSNQVQSPRSIPSVVIITGPDLGPLVFTITEATGRPANWKRITILNPTIAGRINYDWSIYKGDAYAGGEFVGAAFNVTSEGTFDIDLSPFPLTVSMTNLRFYLAQSVGVPPGRRQSWQPFTVSEDIQYLAPPTGLVACFIVDGGYVQLYWEDNTSYESGYEIYRSTDGGGFARLNVAGVDATSYQDHNVDNIPGKKYRYRVVAVKGSLSSEPSNDADVWMDMETLPAPGWIRAYESNGEVLMELSLNYPGSISGITIDYDVAAHYPGGQLGDELSPWTLWARDMPITNTIKSPAAPWRTWYHRIRIKKDGYVSKWSTVMKVGYGENTNPPMMNWSIMGAIQTLTKAGVYLPQRTAAYYLSGQYNPHSIFGSFRRPVRPFGIHLDTVGSWNNIIYNFIRDKQGFGWLGFTSSGPYKRSVETDDAYYEREDVPDRRFWTLHQDEVEGTTIPVLNNGFINPNPAPVGKTFTTDAGASYTVTEAMKTAFRWDVIWWYIHRDLTGLRIGAQFGRLRLNMENHNIIYGTAPGYYDVLRNIAENGTGYASAANGGTDPYYKTLTDEQFQNNVLVQMQANINAWLASDANDKAPGIQVMIYGDGQSAFVQNGGVRLDQTFYKQTPFGRPADLLGSGSYGWIDTLLMACPFFIARTDKQDRDGQNIFADLCIADGWAATDTVVGGEPEFFRYSVSDAHPNGRVTVRFEDGNGNLCKTTKKYILENDYGGAGQKVEVPIGTTVISYNNAARLPNWFFNSSIDDFVDDSLVNYFWHYALFLFATRKPLSHQVYPWMISLRHQGKPNENSFTAQMPRRFVHGMNFLSQVYWVNQIWYQLQMYSDINGGQNSVGVCRTMDALIESNYMIAELNMHFNRAEVTKVPEISMDGGQTWTSGTQCFRNTAYAPDHFKYVDGAYSAEWIRARRNAAQTSPLVLVSYNQFNRSWVIFEKAVFGPSISYSMRVKDQNGNYTYFNNRKAVRDWNRDIIYF